MEKIKRGGCWLPPGLISLGYAGSIPAPVTNKKEITMPIKICKKCGKQFYEKEGYYDTPIGLFCGKCEIPIDITITCMKMLINKRK